MLLQVAQPTISMPGSRANKSYFDEDTGGVNNANQQKQGSASGKLDNSGKKATVKDAGKQNKEGYVIYDYSKKLLAQFTTFLTVRDGLAVFLVRSH